MERSHEHLVPHPDWYGLSYPTWEDMETYAWNLGAVVTFGPVAKGVFYPPVPALDIQAVIGIPQGSGPLAQIWSLAHELGHLVQHTGPKGELFWSKNEAQANRWAARAVIPEERIQAHRNASLDAFVGALSAHFEDLPLIGCNPRRLAGKIARIRLKILEENVANGY